MVQTRRTLLRGALAAAATGLAGCTDGGGGGTPTDTQGDGSTPRPDPTVAVAPDGNFRFRPESIQVRAGTTVTWVWEGSGHNVVVESQPSGASWEGTPGGAGETYDAGYQYSHTFDVPGTYAYYCEPHRQFGMTGSVTVVES